MMNFCPTRAKTIDRMKTVWGCKMGGICSISLKVSCWREMDKFDGFFLFVTNE